MKCWWTMLIPRAMASDGPAIVTSLAVEQDLAVIGLGQPVEDVHERGLAGAVLAEQGVDLAGPDLEVDVVVGDDARIALGDAAHLERGCCDGRDVDGRDVCRSPRWSSVVVPQQPGTKERTDRRLVGPLTWRARNGLRLGDRERAAFGRARLERPRLHAGERLVQLGLGIGGDHLLAAS